jgi:hypothetical protein
VEELVQQEMAMCQKEKEKNRSPRRERSYKNQKEILKKASKENPKTEKIEKSQNRRKPNKNIFLIRKSGLPYP